jgi:hypothetical protein
LVKMLRAASPRLPAAASACQQRSRHMTCVPEVSLECSQRLLLFVFALLFVTERHNLNIVHDAVM